MSFSRSVIILAAALLPLGLSAQTADSATPVCSASAATITADGPLAICTGGRVTLTANGGSTYVWSNGATSRSITVTDPGAYTVTATGDDGCSSTSQPVVVAIDGQPDAMITTPSWATAASSSNKASGPSNATSYAWSITNGTITSAANAQNVAFTAGALGTMSLALTTTNATGCSSTTSRAITTTGQPVISVSNASITAPAKRSTTQMVFTFTLSNPSSQVVTVVYNTSNGTAIASSDYLPSSSVVTFLPGSTTQTVAVTVVGTGAKYTKTLWMNLSRPSNATIATVAGYPMRGKGSITP
jgi:hypothetical protein